MGSCTCAVGGRRTGHPGGLLGRPRPLRVLTATLQRDLSFPRALGELQLRARPACSEHPRRERRPSGPESGSPRERGGSWPSRRSPGSGCGRHCGPPGGPPLLWGSCTPSRLSPAGGAEARTASGSLAGGRQHTGASRAPVSTLRGPEASAGASRPGVSPRNGAWAGGQDSWADCVPRLRRRRVFTGD